MAKKLRIKKSSMNPKQGYKMGKVRPVIKRPVTGRAGEGRSAKTGGRNSKL